VAIRGQGAWRKGKVLEPPSTRRQVADCASLCSRSIGVLQKLPRQRFPGKIRLLGVASLNLVSVAMGQTISALEATPKIWDLAAAWLVLDELHCPIRWLRRDPGQLTVGEDLAQVDFPVLAARDQQTLATFQPWADALISDAAG
jgi:myo-inositol-1(or 4)-monophosphatase